MSLLHKFLVKWFFTYLEVWVYSSLIGGGTLIPSVSESLELITEMLMTKYFALLKFWKPVRRRSWRRGGGEMYVKAQDKAVLHNGNCVRPLIIFCLWSIQLYLYCIMLKPAVFFFSLRSDKVWNTDVRQCGGRRVSAFSKSWFSRYWALSHKSQNKNKG